MQWKIALKIFHYTILLSSVVFERAGSQAALWLPPNLMEMVVFYGDPSLLHGSSLTPLKNHFSRLDEKEALVTHFVADKPSLVCSSYHYGHLCFLLHSDTSSKQMAGETLGAEESFPVHPRLFLSSLPKQKGLGSCSGDSSRNGVFCVLGVLEMTPKTP